MGGIMGSVFPSEACLKWDPLTNNAIKTEYLKNQHYYNHVKINNLSEMT